MPLALLCAVAGLAGAARAALPAQPEDELKAAVVLGFLRYTDWPALQPESSPVTVGVLGRQEFSAALRQALAGKSEGKRPFRLVELKTAADGRACQLVYFAMDSAAELKPALEALHESHVLTIGENDRFLELGGEVNLFLLDGRIRFEFRRSALQDPAYAISSKLLRFGQLRSRIKGAN